eukprot:6163354-Ditylum_brightwellii.AAC.1
MMSTTTTRVPVMDASGGLFAMMAATGIHDHNNRAMLQEVLEVEDEDKSDSNEESDNNKESNSNEESVDPGCVRK